MRALCWHGKGDVRVDTVPDPTIQHPRDAIIKITACAICGSDLHLYDGYQPTMESGDILGHESKGLTLKTGQTHVQAYTRPLLAKIESGESDPSFVVTHPASLEDAPELYKKFRDESDGVIKVVLRPGARM